MGKRIREAFLVATDSPKSAWYSLIVEEIRLLRGVKAYLVVKRSGIEEGKCLHTLKYFKDDIDQAIDLFEKRLAQKLDPGRRTPRKYRLKRKVSFPVQSGLFSAENGEGGTLENGNGKDLGDLLLH